MKQVEKKDCIKHGMEHVNTVVDLCVEILEKIPQEVPVNREACIVSAYWHDIGRIEKNEGHAEVSLNCYKKS